jgi:hypothetical protein
MKGLVSVADLRFSRRHGCLLGCSSSEMSVNIYKTVLYPRRQPLSKNGPVILSKNGMEVFHTNDVSIVPNEI